MAGYLLTPKKLKPLPDSAGQGRWFLAQVVGIAALVGLGTMAAFTTTRTNRSTFPGATPTAHPSIAAETPAAVPEMALNPSPTPTPTNTPEPTPTPTKTPEPTPTRTPTPTLEDRYQRLLREYPNIEEYIRLLRAREAMPAPAAIAELEAIVTEYPNSPAAHEAHLSLARHLASTGDPHAYDHYQAALALDAPPLLKLEWARYLESVGRSAEAYSTYREITRRYPDEARPALKRTAPDPLTLARDLMDFRFPQEALEVLPAPTASGPPTLLALRARAFLALGRVEEALSTYEAWLSIDPNSRDALLGRAGALARLGRSEEALAIYAAIPTIGAQLTRGEILDGLGRKEEALNLYRSLSDPTAWWRAAGLLEQFDRAGESLPLYEQAARSNSSLADDSAYRLWVLARRVGDGNRTATASQILESIWPNYFALLARDTGFSVDLSPPLPTPGQAAPVVDKASALGQIGHPDWAISELAYAARATEDPRVDLALGQELYQRGAYREAFRIGAALIRYPDPAVRTLAAWRLAYPKAYPNEVAAAAQEFGVEPLFIWSVMRQESGYNPEVVSFAYAQGLMQVIPSTRDDIARALKISVGLESMFDPATSVRFGAYFLGAMWRRFGGDPEYTAVAYNGGGGTVDRTLSNSLVRERDDFYRWITKVESREFVNRVMLNYAVYRWLEEIGG